MPKRKRNEELIHRCELILSGPADGTHPIGRQFLKGGVGRDIAVRVTCRGIINISTHLALIFLHDFLLGKG
jgi:hypothetical protein